MRLPFRFALALALAAATAAAGETGPQFFPNTQNAATGMAVTPAQFTSSKECAYCHPLQYEQWQGSMHANAFEDPLFQAVWREASRDFGGKQDPLCAGCHTPVGTGTETVWVRESGEIVIHPRAREGVLCDFCHSVTEVRLLKRGESPGNAGLVVDTDGPKRGPYADASQTFHATAFSELHTDSRFCGACHNIFHPVSGAEIARTYDEWKGSVYARKEIHCQDCHMVPPEVAARVADTLEKPIRQGQVSVFSAVERGPFYDHTFTGANVAIPSVLKHWLHAADARLRLLSAAKLAVNVSGEARPGTSVEIAVRVENARAGHNLPTSMSELREMWLHVVLTDAKGKTLWESGGLDSGGRLDPSARRYGLQAVDGEGKATWKPWKIQKIERDTSIPPKSSVNESFRVPVPPGAEAPFKVSAALRYRSFSQEVADTYLGRPGWTVPVVNMVRAEASVGTSR